MVPDMQVRGMEILITVFLILSHRNLQKSQKAKLKCLKVKG